MIVIEYIYIEGFGSIVDEVKYKFDRPGINLLLGENGIGKTTIFNALSWCLFKQVLKKGSGIEPWDHIKTKDYVGTRVRVCFRDSHHQYEVIRHSDYKGKTGGQRGGSRLVILQDGSPVFTERDKSDANKWIREKLGYSFELFKSAVLFGQKLKRLTEEDGPTKKKVFDEAFETTFIVKAKELVEKRLTTKINTYEKQKAKLDGLLIIKKNQQQEYTRAKEILKSYQLIQDEKLERLNWRRQCLDDERAVLVKNFDVQANKEKQRDLRQRIEEVNNLLRPDLLSTEFNIMLELNAAETKLLNIKDKTKKLRIELNKVEDTCSKCSQSLPKKELKEYKANISKSLAAEEAEIEVLEGKLKKLRKKHERSKKLLGSQESHKRTKSDLEDSLRGLEKSLERFEGDVKWKDQEIEEVRKQIKELHSEKPPTLNLKEIKQGLLRTKSEIQSLRQELKSDLKSIRIDEWLIKEPLSNAGLKAFIFDSMLSRVNNHLKAYKNIIGFGISTFIDMSSARKDIRIAISHNENEVPYEDLSGGQKQLVDVVLAFALHDTVHSIKPVNILLMDEVFESLSTNNIEVVGSILQKVGANKSIHLITHHSQFQPVNCYKTYLAFQDGRTSIATKYREN
jgi:exonuclease SbcC